MRIITRQLKENAEAFILRWRGTRAERAEAQTFSNEFFQIFGLDRKDLAQFEKPIRKKDESGTGFADLFWSGKLIIESKSADKDNIQHWEKTLIQAEEYIDDLKPHQKPQFILLMNFKRIRKYSVEINKSGKAKVKFLIEVPLEKLAEQLDHFLFFIEFAERLETDEEKVNQEAARKIANVYDAIERKGYKNDDIAILLARILFCLFAEDTGIFKPDQFCNFLSNHTTGANLGEKLLALFKILNTHPRDRKENDKILNDFPYVNGDLFDTRLSRVPATTNALRNALLNACSAYDWSDISPVIFGSLFQAVMDDTERRSLGAHFTSERNILRVVRPLFLDELHEQFSEIKSSKTALEKFRAKINALTFLDPACGCGNFLVVTYRELRLLDIEIIRKIYKGTRVLDASWLSNVPLENFYGYEIDSTSAMIAKVALWLTEHQMNMRLESEFGKAVPTIPLDESAVIVNDNALNIDWKPEKRGKVFNYILGNPPFIGKQHQTEEQKKDVARIFNGTNGTGVLDYVACWYIKAAEYMKTHPETRTALVSTNSIAQGEQPGILWNYLFRTYKLKIQFAHQTFKWHNEAEGVAAVHCVVIGFGKENLKVKYLYEYNDIKGEPIQTKVKNINPYLVQGNDTTILKRRVPICNVPEISFGSMPNDGGHLLLTDEEKKELLREEPEAKKWVRPLLSAHEFLHGKKRWCLWLAGIQPKELKSLSSIYKRVQAVRKHRTESDRGATNKLAATPYLFGEIRQPKSNYILIPRHSSENRDYIPFGFFASNHIVSDSCSAIDKATLYQFGILTSAMHMTWVRYVCGRLESRYRYSNEIVYNNFPWPNGIPKRKKDAVEAAAQKVIDIRHKFLSEGNSLANIYGEWMPHKLLKAHQTLDKAVDKCYRDAPFTTDAKRIEFLFELYDTYTGGMFPNE
jgi:hypothetical protein